MYHVIWGVTGHAITITSFLRYELQQAWSIAIDIAAVVGVGVETSFCKREKTLVFSINEKKTSEILMEMAKDHPNDSMIKNLQLDKKKWGKSNKILLLIPRLHWILK